MVLTLRILEGPASDTPPRIVRLDIGGASFDHAPGQAVLAATTGFPSDGPYSIAATPATRAAMVG